MRAATGCALVMVGQAALGNPWIFSGERVSRARAARFLLDYAALLSDRRRTRPQGVAGRIKQLLRHWTAGDLLGADRFDWLHEKQPTALLARLEKIAGRP